MVDSHSQTLSLVERLFPQDTSQLRFFCMATKQRFSSVPCKLSRHFGGVTHFDLSPHPGTASPHRSTDTLSTSSDLVTPGLILNLLPPPTFATFSFQLKFTFFAPYASAKLPISIAATPPSLTLTFPYIPTTITNTTTNTTTTCQKTLKPIEVSRTFFLSVSFIVVQTYIKIDFFSPPPVTEVIPS
jgi:hypothetical protein